MATVTGTYNFSIPSFTANCSAGDVLEFRFQLRQTDTTSFIARIPTAGSLSIGSTSPSTGYIVVACNAEQYLASATGNQITFGTALSNFYGDKYQFNPNPITGSAATSVYYSNYGDVRYTFKPSQSDLVVMELSDATYFISAVKEVTKPTPNQLVLTMDQNIPTLVSTDVTNGTYKRFLLIKRYEDEQNVIAQFSKPNGETSYGFIIPNTINEEVLLKINTLQATVQTQLLSNQSNTGLGG